PGGQRARVPPAVVLLRPPRDRRNGRVRRLHPYRDGEREPVPPPPGPPPPGRSAGLGRTGRAERLPSDLPGRHDRTSPAHRNGARGRGRAAPVPGTGTRLVPDPLEPGATPL